MAQKFLNGVQSYFNANNYTLLGYDSLDVVGGDLVLKRAGSEKLRIGANTATFTGNVESQDTFILNYNNAGNKWQQLFDGSNGWNLRYYNGTSWSSNYINVNTSGNATFAGDITSTGLTVDYTGNRTGDAGILVTNDSSDWGIKVDKDPSGDDYGILSQTDGDNAIVVRNAAGTTKIQLQGDGDATFAGNISAGSGTFSAFVYAEDEIHLTDAGTTRAKLLLNSSDRDNVELRAESLGSTMKFFTVGTEALELDASQNAIFAGDVTMTQTSGNNVLYINSSGGGNPVIYMQDSAVKWGQFVASGELYFKNETTNVNTLKLIGSNATFAGKVRANSWFQGADGTNTLWANSTSGVLIQTPGSTANNNDSKIYFRNSGTTIKHTFDTNTGDATFAGTIDSGAVTSTGIIKSNRAEATLQLVSTHGRSSSINQGGGNLHIHADHGSGVGINYGNTTNPGLLKLYNNTTSKVTLDATHGDATFSGGVSIIATSAKNYRVTDGTQNIWVGSSGNTRFGLGAGSSIIQSTGAAFGIGTQDGNALRFGTDNTEALTISSTQDATFTGNVTLQSTAPTFYLDNTTSTTGKNWRLSSAANGKMYIAEHGVVDAITLEHTSGNATFAGTVKTPTLLVNATAVRESASKLSVQGGMSEFETGSVFGNDWANSPVSILERGNIASGSSDNKYAPNLNFHWSGRVSNSLWMSDNGHLHYGSYSSTGVPSTNGTFKAGYFHGDGSNLTGITVSNADTVDNVHATSFLRSDQADTGTGTITLADSSAADNPLILGSSSQTSYTLQQWQTSSHGTNNAYLIAYGAGHGSQAGNFAMKNTVSSGEIFFELAGGVLPLRMTSIGSTFAGNIGTGGLTATDVTGVSIKSQSTSSQESAINIIQHGTGTNPIIRMGEKSTDGGRFHMFDGGVEKIAFYTDGTANHISAGGLTINDSANPDGGGGAGEGGSLTVEGRRDGTANLISLRARDASAPTVALPNGQGGLIRWQGFDGTDFAQMGAIAVVADGQAVANSDAPSKMIFYTTPDGSDALTTALTLDKSQNAAFTGTITTSDNSNDNYIAATFSDSSYVRMHGYGLYMSRNNSYIRPTTDTGKTLYIGSSDKRWDNVDVHATAATFSGNVNAPGLVYNATNKYLSISHWSSPPTPAAMLHLSDNSNDLDVPQIRIEGRDNPGDTRLDIAVKDADVRFNLVEGSTDASAGYGKMHFKTNANANSSNPTRGGFLFQTGAGSVIDALTITNEGKATFASDTTFSAGVVKKGSGGYYLHNSSGAFRAAFWDNGSETRLFADGDGSTATLVINDNNTYFAGTVTVNGDYLAVGNADNATTLIQTRSSAGQLSGIKLARGAGDWSSTGNNNFGLLVSDNGIELAKLTALGQNTTGRAPYLTIADGGNATFAGTITVGGDITATGADFTLAHAAGATVFLRRDDTSISDGNVLGLINFQGDDPTDGTFNTGVALMGKAAGDWASGSYESEFILQTRNTSGALVTALTINEAQNAAFAGTLSVGGGDSSTAQVALKGQQSLLSFLRGTSGDAQFFMSSDSARLYFSHTDIQSTNLILTLNQDKSATFAGAVTVGNSSGNTLLLKKGTGTPSIAFAGTATDPEASALIEGIAGGGLKIYTSNGGTIGTPGWSPKFDIAAGGNATFKGDVQIDGSLTGVGAFVPVGGGTFSGAVTVDDTFTVKNHDTTSSIATQFMNGKRTNGTNGPFGELIFSNNNDSVATVAGFRDGADNKGSLVFQTQNGTSGFGTWLTIKADGKIGAGTQEPAAHLQVERASGATFALSASSALTSGNRGDLAWYNSDDSTVANIRAAADTDNVGTKLQFFTREVGGSLTNTVTINASGSVSFTQPLYIPDSKKINLGSSQDLQLYHNGSESVIKSKEGAFYIQQEKQDGNLIFQADNGENNATSADYFYLDGGSAVHDGSSTTEMYTIWKDKSRIAVGNSKDLQLYHDGSNSYIKSSTGWLNMPTSGSGISMANSDFSKQLARFWVNGASELYYDGTIRLETVSDGAKVTGKLDITGANSFITHGTSWGQNLKLTNTNNDASPPVLTFLKHQDGGHSQIANNDYVGFTNYRMKNTNGDEFSWVELSALATVVTDGSESSAYRIGTWRAGVEYANTLISTAGQVGVGLSDPSARLTVKGLGGSTGLTFKTTDSSSNETFYIMDGGRVGVRYYPLTIGVASTATDPTTSGDRLFVSGTAKNVAVNSAGNLGIGIAPGAQFHNYSTATRDIFISGHGTQAQNDWQAEHAFFTSAGQGVIVGKANANNNTNRLHILYNTSSGDAQYLGYNSSSVNKIKLNTNGDSYLDGGDVGIGTTSPGRKLTITGDTSGDANNLLLANENDTDGDSASIGFSMLSNNTYVKAGIFFKRTTTQGRGDLIFANNNEVNGNNVALSDAKITIKPSGDTAFAGIVSINTGKAFRLYNAAGNGWGELTLNETDNKIQFNRGVTPSGNEQADQTLGLATKRWHTVYAHDGDFSGDVIAGASGTGNIYVGNNGTGNFARFHTNNSHTYFDMSCGNVIWRKGSAGGSHRFEHNMTSGTFTSSGDIIAYGSPSDVRLKENIKPIDSALDKVMKLQGVTFDWKKSDSILDIKEDIGFIAQDVKEVVPELVRENEDGMLSMRHQGITPILLEAIKQLKAEIEELKSNKCNCNK